MVKLNDEKIMIIGGSGNQQSVIIFDPVTKEFKNGPTLKYNFYYGACILMNSALHGNRPVVLAGAGSNRKQNEVYDYTQSQSWEEFPSLPTTHGTDFYGATAVKSETG